MQDVQPTVFLQHSVEALLLDRVRKIYANSLLEEQINMSLRSFLKLLQALPCMLCSLL